MSNTSYEDRARWISDLKNRLVLLTACFEELTEKRQHYQSASDFLGLLERQIHDTHQTEAWLEFLQTIGLRERYETTVGHPNGTVATAGDPMLRGQSGLLSGHDRDPRCGGQNPAKSRPVLYGYADDPIE